MKVTKPLNLDTTMQGLSQTTVNMTDQQKFQSVLSQATGALAGIAGAAAPFFPGAAIVSAALSDVSQQAAQGGGNLSPFGGPALGLGQSYAAMPGGGGMGGGMGGGIGSAVGGAVGSSIAGGVAGGMASIMGAGGMGGMGGVGAPPGGGNALSTMGNPQAQMQQAMQQNMYLLQVQQQAAQQNEQFTTLSNLMSSRHQMAQSAIQNIK